MVKEIKDATITLRTTKYYKSQLKLNAKISRLSLNSYILHQLMINGRMPYIVYQNDMQYQEISSLLTNIQVKINHLAKHENDVAWIASALAYLFLRSGTKHSNSKQEYEYFKSLYIQYGHIAKWHKSKKYWSILSDLNTRQQKLLRLFHKYVITDRAASRNKDTSTNNLRYKL